PPGALDPPGPPRSRLEVRSVLGRKDAIGVALGLVAAAAFLTSCRVPTPGPELTYRHEREQAVRAALPPAETSRFRGLRYYPYDPGCRLEAMIEPITPPEAVRIAASSGAPRPAHRVGRVRLALPGGTAVLTVFQLDDIRDRYPDMLFLPFRDVGAGRATYGAGRYVDVERRPGGVVTIDFNRAYNPDCAYGIAGECPIAPPENTLPFAVRAGEMIPPGHG
ncbi:MAG TPA: DUF1684 domain-containing protein, partial [Thermoanaerobaculaceae bacterium]|nr:DUF1684 domain-containing protein [Thermoanaerobaculaceae bacterium]